MDDPDTPSEPGTGISRRNVLTTGAAAVAGIGTGMYVFGKNAEPVVAVDYIGWVASNLTIESDQGRVDDLYIDTDDLTVEVEWENFDDDSHSIDMYFHFELTGNHDGDASASDVVATSTGQFLGSGPTGDVMFTGDDFDGDDVDGASLLDNHSDFDASDFDVRDEDRDGNYERTREVRATLEVDVHDGGGDTHNRQYSDTFIVIVDEIGGVVEAGGSMALDGEGA